EDAANRGRLLATGYSCRSQAGRLSGKALLHPLQGLLAVLKTSRPGRPRPGESPRLNASVNTSHRIDT
ncbi:hypothetical protein ACOJCM_18760, partial [Billgrantia sp. LNSP4103-1]|uniref:hypothetical protein n=1 Tax=Billgrantia sp. LNSP4103-1 TaxID=3410266 RepID=UPI00403F4B8D